MLSRLYSLLRDSYALFQAQRAPRLAAALAFYALISLSPLVVVAMGVLDLIFDDETARLELIALISRQLPASVADTIVPIIESAGRSTSGGLAAFVGVLILIAGASNVFNQLQDILNRLWGIEQPQKPIWRTLKERALAFVMVLGFGLLLVLVMIGQTALSALASALPETFFRFNWVPFVSAVLGLVLMTLLFGLIFRILPNAVIPWQDAFIGGMATALLFRLGLWAVSWYVGRSSAGSAYGVAGSLLVTLLVIYYVSMIFLFGAALTRILGLGNHVVSE